MPIRFTGMNSGLDTDTIIKELVKVQSVKTDNIRKSQTKLGWKQEAWKDLNAKVNKLFTGTLDTLRWGHNYKKKVTDISDKNAISIISGEGSMNATQKIHIANMAKSGYLTGEKLAGSTPYSGTSKLVADLGITEGSSFSVAVDGKKTDITVTADTTLDNLVGQLRGAGVEANFDTTYQKFFIGSLKSGEAQDFSIISTSGTGVDALQKLGIFTYDKAAMKEYERYKNMDAAAVAAEADGDVARRLASYISRKTNYDKTIVDQQKAMDTMKADFTLKYGSDTEYNDIETIDKTALEQDIKDLKDQIKNETNEDTKKTLNDKLTELTAKQSDLTTYENSKKAKSDAAADLAKIEPYYTVEPDGKIVASQKLKDEAAANVQSKVNEASDVLNNKGSVAASSAVRIEGQGAKVSLNGVDYESDNNTFNINGLTITVLSETNPDVTITTRDDTDGVYDMIKGFMKEYNALIKEMDKLYNAESAKGYEPMTDEEKDSISEEEAKKWDIKIKDALLRKDSTLSTVSSAMKMAMSGGVELNGKSMYLSDFGIETIGYFGAAENEKNIYHIAGDQDDDTSKNSPDKLKAMISSDPDTVVDFFAKLANNVYGELNTIMKGTDFRTTYCIYDDKKMKEDYTNYTTKIANQEKKLKAMEDKWYNKFGAMETALARLQSNQSAVTSLLGG